MPTNTYTPIASVTLSATASEVVFSGLPQTFRDLIVAVNATSAAESVTRWTFNGDNSSVYSRVVAVGLGSAFESIADTQAFFNPNHYSAVSNTSNSNMMAQIMDYSQTNKHKSVLFRSNQVATERGPNMTAGRWANTSAVTSIRILSESSTFSIGSTFTIFGIAG